MVDRVPKYPRFWGLDGLGELMDAPDGKLVWVERLEDIEPATWTITRQWDGSFVATEDPVGTRTMDEINAMTPHDRHARRFGDSPECFAAFEAVERCARADGWVRKPVRCLPKRLGGKL